MKLTHKLWIGIIILTFLSPLGLILPAYFKAGPAWGEWGMDEIEKLAGYIPRGLARFSSLWKAPVPDYALRGGQAKGLPFLSFAYIISAMVGIAIIVLVVFLLAKLWIRRDN